MAHVLEEKERTKDVILEENVSFKELFLPQHILDGLEYHNFKKPSPIQLKSIPVGRCGFDLIVKSKSGTGKTVVFSVIALESVNLQNDAPQVLILGPTREIAVQIQEVLQNLGQFMKGLRVQYFIGGTPVESDKLNCSDCHIAVGAPGRIKHLIKDGHLRTTSIRLFVLDEADKLMESSFENDINEIYNLLPDKKQMITTSATYPNDLEEFLSRYMLSPTHVTAELESPLLLGLKQFVKPMKRCNTVAVQMKNKNEALLKLLAYVSFTQCLIFSNFQTRAESISNYLNQHGWDSTFISAAQSQKDRLGALASLKDFKCRIMLSTDLVARGIDASSVDLVINYDVPVDTMTYLHRMGRAGRYGSSGVCITMAFEDNEMKVLRNIIGAIGGVNLSIPVLPDVENISLDLLKLDTNTLEFIHGSISTEVGKNIDFKSQVFEMKNTTNKNKSCNKEKKKAKQELLDEESVLNILDESKSNTNKDENMDIKLLLESMAKGSMQISSTEIHEKNTEIDTKLLLQSLAKGSPELTKSTETKLDETQDILQQLASGDFYKKRKRPELDKSPNSIENQKEKCQPIENIFFKNRALLSVSKMLYDSQTEPDKDDMASVDQYLNILKEEENIDVQNFLIDSTKQDISNVGNPCTSQNLTTNKTMENIFEIGYEYAVNPNAPHWLKCLPESEIKKLEDLHISEEQEENLEWEDEDDDFDEDCEINEESTVDCVPRTVKDLANDPNYSFMKWVPVKKNQKPSYYNETNNDCVLFNRNDTNMEEEFECPEEEIEQYQRNETFMYDSSHQNHTRDYSSYMDQCSNQLWQNGLNFNNAQEFDNWFHNNWQQQVNSVRSYIQQNIYVEEMNRYQRSHNYYNN
ncbi:unnamed protein product [Brassicogethes aeneus]|uniref:RNA helicase n=1 Tax=Brassicogethes aeneus TaxID=1431903 RepID=A0A9P0F927_BRAAE|nr:unnamed protein product [Brassicogethes aeneus]